MEEKLLTVREVSERPRLKVPTIRKMVVERRIDVVRPSKRAVRIPESAVRRIIERGLTKARR